MAGRLLFVLAPLITHSWSPALAATFLLLPAYILAAITPQTPGTLMTKTAVGESQ